MPPKGFYQHPSGELRPDRRKKGDRRSRANQNLGEDDRRMRMRRRDDWARLDREHAEQVEEALEEFAIAKDQV